MKKILALLFLFLIIITLAQEKISLNKGEITIPIGKKIILKPLLEDNKIVNFEIIQEQNITDKVDLMQMLKNFKKDDKKDDKKDNSIDFSFSEAQMMNNPLFVLTTVQKTGKRLTFKAKIRLRGTSLYAATSIIPVVSNVTSVEQWNDIIDSIFLYDFKLED